VIPAGRLHDVTRTLSDQRPKPTTRPTCLRSSEMSQLMYEDLARAHLNERLAQAEQARLSLYVVRLARARRRARKARRQVDQAQLRLRLLAG
jgi:hypothetical protein